MEVPACIPLLPQFFLHLLSTYTDLPHFLSLKNPSHASFYLIPSFDLRSALFTFSIHFTYHCLYQSMIIPPHTIRPCQLICCFLQSQHVHQLHCIPLVHQLYTAHRPHHKSFCSSQNSYFIFSQTLRFASI